MAIINHSRYPENVVILMMQFYLMDEKTQLSLHRSTQLIIF
jgi:hypothetical protein